MLGSGGSRARKEEKVGRGEFGVEETVPSVCHYKGGGGCHCAAEVGCFVCCFIF